MADASTRGFRHDALLYGDDADLLATAVPFVEDGLGAGEAIAVVARAEVLDPLANALGRDADAVLLADRADWYDTPARGIAHIVDFRERRFAQGATGLRTFGEIDFDGAVDEQRGWLRYEAVLNRVLAFTPHWGMCAYGLRKLPEWILDYALRTHPHVVDGSGRQPSPHYDQPERVAAELAPPPPSVPGEPVIDMRVSGHHDLITARRRVFQVLHAAGVPGARSTELAVGLNEVVTNALEHGSDTARLRCWQNGCDHVVFEVADSGPGIDDPLVGFRPPDQRQTRGRGMWLARQTFDTVSLQTPASGEGLLVTVAAAV